MVGKGHYRFVVNQKIDGSPWLVAEPLEEPIPALGQHRLGFDLVPGTTMDQARQFTTAMNAGISAISIVD